MIDAPLGGEPSPAAAGEPPAPQGPSGPAAEEAAQIPLAGIGEANAAGSAPDAGGAPIQGSAPARRGGQRGRGRQRGAEPSLSGATDDAATDATPSARPPRRTRGSTKGAGTLEASAPGPDGAEVAGIPGTGEPLPPQPEASPPGAASDSEGADDAGATSPAVSGVWVAQPDLFATGAQPALLPESSFTGEAGQLAQALALAGAPRRRPYERGIERAVARAAAEDARVLMALLTFRRTLDHQALSLCLAHFRPLATIFDTPANKLRAFFGRHRHLRGVTDAATLADPAQQDAARRAAASRIDAAGRLTERGLPGVLVTASHPRFPSRLAQRGSFPVEWLFCYPAPPPDPMPGPVVAIVGSRRSDAQQRAAAAAVAAAVGTLGGTVVTGLATGADAAAHAAAVPTPAFLVAVLGSGVRKVYPPEHTSWVHQLVEGRGVVLTETPSDSTANADAFVLRNRIVAGLADVVVAVSGEYASGTSHTLRFAAGMGVPVVSADPQGASGITRLARELGGVHLAPEVLGHVLASIPRRPSET